MDGSSRVVEGQQKPGYAIVDGYTFKIKESGPLSKVWSAQACELYAMLRALKLFENKIGTIQSMPLGWYILLEKFRKREV